MKALIVCLFLLGSLAFAQVNVDLDVSIESKTSLSESQAKSALLQKALINSVYKLVTDLGFSSQEFEQKLQEKFGHYFDRYKEKNLIDKFGKDYSIKIQTQEVKDYSEILNSSRELEFAKFTRLNELTSSYSIKNLISVENQNLIWNGSVHLVLDKEKLTRFYRRIISGDSTSFQKIILLADITNQNFSWNDMGLNGPDSFLGPINQSWMKWLNDHISSTVEEIILCPSDCRSFWSQWIEIQSSEVISRIPIEYSNSAWLKIDINLKKVTDKIVVTGQPYEWTGRLVLLDTNTKQIIASFQIGPESRIVEDQTQQTQNSILASQLYKSPLGSFVLLNRLLQQKISLNRVSQLSLVGHSHLGDVFGIINQLKTRGSSLGLDIRLDSFSKTEAKLSCLYKGEEKSFTDLLSSIKELKSNRSYSVVSEFNGVHHLMKLILE